MIVTIDGPVASGKSTVARKLAQRLHFYYLYTGMLYRGLAYVLVHILHYSDAQMRNLTEADVVPIMTGDTFGYEYIDGQPHVLYKGQDITAHLKNPDIDHWSSIISSQPVVREAVFDRQVRIGDLYDVVTEGRDTGSVVFPHADYKFFLTASPQVRAQRWQADQKRRGFEYSLEESLQIITNRDKRDRERTLSPLVEPNGATIIDNGDLTIGQTIDLLEEIIKGKSA